MQKLIITYNWCDSSDVSGNEVIPIQYESEEQFIIDSDEWAINNVGNSFMFADTGFLGTDIYPDTVFSHGNFSNFRTWTLDNWFEQHCNK